MMNLPVQHLSDEAIVAYADDALGSTARARATRHLATCVECTHAVSVQREAVWALRSSPVPDLPSGLLDRLRSVPSTTDLPRPPIALDDNGQFVFPAFGTKLDTSMTALPAPIPVSSPHRRHATLGLLTAAAAMVTLGAVGATTASATGDRVVPVAPAPAQVVPASAHVPVTGAATPGLGAPYLR